METQLKEFLAAVVAPATRSEHLSSISGKLCKHHRIISFGCPECDTEINAEIVKLNEIADALVSFANAKGSNVEFELQEPAEKDPYDLCIIFDLKKSGFKKLDTIQIGLRDGYPYIDILIMNITKRAHKKTITAILNMWREFAEKFDNCKTYVNYNEVERTEVLRTICEHAKHLK